MAKADTTPRQTVRELTGFRRDLLYVVADVGPAKGLKIKDAVGQYYTKEVNTGQLYPNLDTLADMGLIDKGSLDRRTNSYELTPKGKRALEARREWEDKRVGEVLA